MNFINQKTNKQKGINFLLTLETVEQKAKTFFEVYT